MSNLIISPSASRDLNQIADYFLEGNLEAGEKLFREFIEEEFRIQNSELSNLLEGDSDPH
ncbi:MAG: hypothetical protein DSM106950_45275 [Stigonema ocellatum SAG 48.90 = DSM 106950]|nr:hypothetical protein [Stigonema ocellatum SAG 48.90 = DSM 106950]